MNIPVIGMSGAVIIMFLGILIMYTYVDETRQNQQELKETQQQMNASINQILEKQAVRWHADNIRFNATLTALGTTYKDIQTLIRLQEAEHDASIEGFTNITDILLSNQKKIIDLTNAQIELTNIQNNNTANNLNLTRFNRAALVDTNNIIRELAQQQNVTLRPFNSSKIG